jgi:subtilisin family serine protease
MKTAWMLLASTICVLALSCEGSDRDPQRSARTCLGSDGYPVPIYKDGIFNKWISGSRGTTLDTKSTVLARENTTYSLQASTKPFAELSFRSVEPFCDDAVLDMYVQGNAISRASFVLYSSRLGVVSEPVGLWRAEPEKVLQEQILRGSLRVVGPDRQDWFRVSINLKAAVKNRELKPESQQSWDTIILRDDSGRGFSILVSSATILPGQEMGIIKDGSSGVCVGSVCHEDLGELEQSQMVPLFGYAVPLLDSAQDRNCSDNCMRNTKNDSIVVNGRLPDDGFSMAELIGLCQSIAPLGTCMLDELDLDIAEREPEADVYWPIVSIKAFSLDNLTDIRRAAWGSIRWMEVNEMAETTVDGAVGLEWSSVQGQGFENFLPVIDPSNITQTSGEARSCPGIPWGLERIGRYNLAPSMAGAGVNVHVLDTGISPSPDFGTRLTPGVNCISGSCETGGAEDNTGHGTHVAGIIGGKCFGVAPEVTITPVKVLAETLFGGYDGVIAGLKYSLYQIQKNGSPGLINMSLGGPRSAALNDAVKRVVSLGVPVVTSSGNDGFSNACTLSPSSAPSAVTVSATTIDDQAASFSNVGSCVDIWAPGKDIPSIDFNNFDSYRVLSGTSMATPHVTGTLALLLGLQSELLPKQAWGAVLQSSLNLDLAPDTTRWFLNLDRLEQSLLETLESGVTPPIDPFGRAWSVKRDSN